MRDFNYFFEPQPFKQRILGCAGSWCKTFFGIIAFFIGLVLFGVVSAILHPIAVNWLATHLLTDDQDTATALFSLVYYPVAIAAFLATCFACDDWERLKFKRRTSEPTIDDLIKSMTQKPEGKR